MSFAYMAFGIFIAFFIRRGTLALFTYFMYANIIETILMAVHMYYFKHESRNFWPMNSIEDLMPLPLYRMSDYFVKKQFDFNIVLSYPVAFGMTTLYTTIFLFLAYRNFIRRDI